MAMMRTQIYLTEEQRRQIQRLAEGSPKSQPHRPVEPTRCGTSLDWEPAVSPMARSIMIVTFMTRTDETHLLPHQRLRGTHRHE